MTSPTHDTPSAPGDADDLTPLRHRLRRVAGQVMAIERMLAENRSCEDVLIQLGAVQGALRAVGQRVLACHLADALGAVGAGTLPAVAAAEEAAFLAGLRTGTSSPHTPEAGGKPTEKRSSPIRRGDQMPARSNQRSTT